MLMSRIEDDQAFAAIVEKRGGLTAAARHLRRSPQSVSRSLVALERDIAVELPGCRGAQPIIMGATM
jgi:DNA-binding transcriptional LysR family regulator